jgi:nucleotide-binding universal stress UspA family protein
MIELKGRQVMAYKSIFTVVSDEGASTSVVDQAVVLAEAQDAHLDVMCLGVDRSQTSYYEVGVNAAILQVAIEQAHAKASALQEIVEKKLANSGVRWSTTIAVATSPDAGHPVTRAARFADIAVVPLPYGETQSHEDITIVEELLFNASCPTLCVPTGTSHMMPKDVVIGWNESAEALRAIRASLPFLKAAKSVHIAVIDPPAHGPERSDPGGSLAVLLARHGVNCDIQVMARSGGSVQDVLARHVRETGAELLVMGGYGHSRFREAILGGATRHMLEHSEVPVLMAH